MRLKILLPSETEGKATVADKGLTVEPFFYAVAEKATVAYIEVIGDGGLVNRFVLRVKGSDGVPVVESAIVKPKKPVVPTFDKRKVTKDEPDKAAPASGAVPAAPVKSA